MKIALDVMSGDFSPQNEILGAVGFLQQNPFVELILLGDESEISQFITSKKLSNDRLSIHHCTSVVQMTDSPADALRKKQDSSLAMSIRLQKEGVVSASVSTGNTGAQLAFTIQLLGKSDGVMRPCIGAFLPKNNGFSFLVDVGSIVDSKPQHLLQFSELATTFLQDRYKKHAPRVGLLNIGSEAHKGNTLSQETHQLLAASKLNFIGNVEGHQILSDNIDIIVTDGFTGNVVLKMYEQIGPFVKDTLKEARNTLMLDEKMNYETYGGVPILGAKGISIICHGKSTPKAISNALETAYQLASTGFPQK
jgi:glycerol-3-phosphate acyltransferase PlsX